MCFKLIRALQCIFASPVIKNMCNCFSSKVKFCYFLICMSYGSWCYTQGFTINLILFCKYMTLSTILVGIKSHLESFRQFSGLFRDNSGLTTPQKCYILRNFCYFPVLYFEFLVCIRPCLLS